MFRKERGRREFIKAEYAETPSELENPGRGWYRLYSFAVQENVDREELKWCLCREEQLVLVMIDIGAYRDRPLDETAVSNIRGILDFFAREHKEIILRIVYDREGKGLEREPSFFSQVQEHMRQIGPLIQETARDIYTVQGIFVGNWGEMHGSRHLAFPEGVKRLADTLWEAVAGSCCLAVRRPVQWRMISESLEEPRMRAGLFDDGMLGSETHLGTFGEQDQGSMKWKEPWGREQELAFEETLCRNVPNGGETVWKQGGAGQQETLCVFQRMHISYLNSRHDMKVLEQWKQTEYTGGDAYRGMSLYEYVGCHLGYRFVVRDAEYTGKKTEKLQVEIENVGFANLYEEAEVILIFQKEDGLEQSCLLNVDARTWGSQSRTTAALELPPLDPGHYQVYLEMRRKRDGRILRFANQGSADRVCLGLLRNLQ